MHRRRTPAPAAPPRPRGGGWGTHRRVLAAQQPAGRQQQHQRAGQVQKADGQVLPAEQAELPNKEIIFSQGPPERSNGPQRVAQHKGQLFTAVYRAAALALNDGIAIAERRSVPFRQQGNGHSTAKAASAHSGRRPLACHSRFATKKIGSTHKRFRYGLAILTKMQAAV